MPYSFYFCSLQQRLKIEINFSWFWRSQGLNKICVFYFCFSNALGLLPLSLCRKFDPRYTYNSLFFQSCMCNLMVYEDEKTYLCASVATECAETNYDCSSRLCSSWSILTSALCVAGSKYGSLSLLLRTMMVRVVVPVKTGEPTKGTVS